MAKQGPSSWSHKDNPKCVSRCWLVCDAGRCFDGKWINSDARDVVVMRRSIGCVTSDWVIAPLPAGEITYAVTFGSFRPRGFGNAPAYSRGSQHTLRRFGLVHSIDWGRFVGANVAVERGHVPLSGVIFRRRGGQLF